MKLLAVFGLALAVVAVDKLDPNNPVYLFEILSKDPGCEICAAVKSEEVFPLIRDCLETGRSSLPKNFLEMDAVHVAAFIFMLRARGNEKTAEYLYNAVMEKRFPVEFAAKLHKQPYPRHPLAEFKRLKAPNPLKEANYKTQLLSSLEAACKIVHETQLLSGLEADHKTQLLNDLEAVHKLAQETLLIGSPEADRKRRFFMLWTVRMYGKGLEGQDAYQSVLDDADQVLLILVKMKIPIEVLAAGLIALQKELPVGVTPDLLPVRQLMFFSLNRGWYLGLGEPEKKDRLRAFLERYLIAKLRILGLQKETLSSKELKQLEDAFESEDKLRGKYLDSDKISELAWYFGKATLAGCPAFLLKRMSDFYLENSSFETEAVLDRKRYFLEALIVAWDLVMRDVENAVCADEKLVWIQMGGTIKVCTEEIKALHMEKPGAKECADLKLCN